MSVQRFQWDDTLLTGVAMIDTQHKEYFRRVNQALASAETDDEAGGDHQLRYLAVESANGPQY